MKKGILIFAAITGLATAGKAQKMYRDNILSIAPIQMTEESPIGVGISYERILDKKGIFGINIPFAISIINQDDYTYYGNDRAHAAYFTLSPGLKVYPFGSHHKVYYGVGPSLAMGVGDQFVFNTIYDPNTQQYYSVRDKQSIFKTGVLGTTA